MIPTDSAIRIKSEADQQENVPPNSIANAIDLIPHDAHAHLRALLSQQVPLLPLQMIYQQLASSLQGKPEENKENQNPIKSDVPDVPIEPNWNPETHDQAPGAKKCESKRAERCAHLAIDAIPEGFKWDDPRDSEFCRVGSRLNLANNQKTYIATVDEMKRRVEGPEKLHSSSMACNLKRPKLKNGGEIMRSKLAEHGVIMNLNTRQAAYPNKLIGLVEAECVSMGKDLMELVEEFYPTEEIGKEVATEIMKKEDVDIQTLLQQIKDFSECMSVMSSVVSSVIPPITGIIPKASKNKSLNHSMENFSCFTHGLGIITNRIWVDQMKEIGEELKKSIEETSKEK